MHEVERYVYVTHELSKHADSEYNKYNSYRHTTSKQHTLMPYTAAAIAYNFVRCDIK